MHYTTLHCTTLYYTTLHCTTLHCIALHYSALHYTTLHCTALHYSALHCTTLYYTALHYTTLYTTPHPEDVQKIQAFPSFLWYNICSLWHKCWFPPVWITWVITAYSVESWLYMCYTIPVPTTSLTTTCKLALTFNIFTCCFTIQTSGLARQLPTKNNESRHSGAILFCLTNKKEDWQPHFIVLSRKTRSLKYETTG